MLIDEKGPPTVGGPSQGGNASGDLIARCLRIDLRRRACLASWMPVHYGAVRRVLLETGSRRIMAQGSQTSHFAGIRGPYGSANKHAAKPSAVFSVSAGRTSVFRSVKVSSRYTGLICAHAQSLIDVVSKPFGEHSHHSVMAGSKLVQIFLEQSVCSSETGKRRRSTARTAPE